jgi:hypothetical protein
VEAVISHQVAACAPTPDRSTTPAKGHTRKEELTQTVPLEKTVALQKPNVHFLLDDLREPRAANALDEPVIAALQYMLKPTTAGTTL